MSAGQGFAAGPSKRNCIASYRIDWSVRIPMRDGVTLNATIFQPLPERGPRSVVLSVTPYNTDTYYERGRAFAELGWIFAIVDTRGRGSSQGDFEPMTDGRNDGYDLVEWLADAAFCDGNVTMWGGSYAGMNQWLAATQRPPHLRAIAPAASALMGYDMPFIGGVYLAWNLAWLTMTTGKTVQANAAASAAYWYETFARLYLEHRPFSDLDLVAGNCATVWREWIAHQHLDAYWDRHNPTTSELSAIDIPILTITGLYDDCCVSSLQLHRAHVAEAAVPAGSRHLVLIGPWDHSGTRAPRRTVGDLAFAAHSMIDLDALHAAWYGWVVHGTERPSLLRDRITYYVSELEEWRSAPDLADITTSRPRFYLQSRAGNAHDVFASGTLAPDANSSSEPATFCYDPLDTRPAQLDRPVDINRPLTLSDQTQALNLFGNGLVYHTPPLQEEIVLAGMPAVELWISMDVPDADLKVALYQIMPDGKSLILATELLRARYRNSAREPELVPLGEIARYRFERLTWNSRLLVRHSRLRLVVSCPNSVYEQKNYCSGGDVMRETAADARPARITLHHTAPYASYVELALGERTSATRLDSTDVLAFVTAESKLALPH